MPTIRLTLVLLFPLVAACGGGGGSSPTSPTPASPASPSTPTTPTAPAPTPPSNFGPYAFTFDTGVSVTDQDIIGNGVQIAHDYLQAAFGRTVTREVSIRGVLSAQGCNQGGAAAFTGATGITFCVTNQGWTAHGPLTKRKIVVHEVYHLLQFERRWIGGTAPTGPDWIVEGSAELVGYRALDSRGLLPYSTATGCQVKEFTDFGVRMPPGLPNLNLLESRQQWQQTQGPLYALAMTGMEQILAARGLTSLNTFMDGIAAANQQWQTVFQQAFGQSTTAFYEQFPAYRAGLTVPASYQCGI